MTRRLVYADKHIIFCYTDNVPLLCGKMACFHVYTKGLEDREIFLDRGDFIAGMNILAVACICSNVDVSLLTFVLMSNHVHFVLRCTSVEKAERFIWLYKNLLSRYLRKRYGWTKYLHRLMTSIQPIPSEGDNLKRLIAYVLNNPVKAGINCVPTGYEWSSAQCYFSNADFISGTIPLKVYSARQKREILHSKKKAPDHWMLTPMGYIAPQCYVDSAAVEKCFVTSRSFEYFLSTSLSARKGKHDNITFSDPVIRATMVELLEKKYAVKSVRELNEFLLKNLIRELRGRFGSPVQQLARIMELTVSEIVRLIE